MYSALSLPSFDEAVTDALHRRAVHVSYRAPESHLAKHPHSDAFSAGQLVRILLGSTRRDTRPDRCVIVKCQNDDRIIVVVL